MTLSLKELGDHVAAAFPEEVSAVAIGHGELVVIARRAAILRVLAFLRDDARCLFAMLVDISGVDYPDRVERFEIVYNLVSLKHNQRIRVKVMTDEEQPVASCVGLYPAASWYERETWDLFGVFFTDHPDLRRLLTDYGFEGHPMRKDFPLTGYVELRYDEDQKRVVYEPVRLKQEFRSFDFLSPWEAMTPHLPGDEKAKGGGGAP